jgi:predicted SAM-dependent methyltransferase
VIKRILRLLRARAVRLLGGVPSAEIAQLRREQAAHTAALQDITAALQGLQAAYPLEWGPSAQHRLAQLESYLPDLLTTLSSTAGVHRRLHRANADIVERLRATDQRLSGDVERLWARIEMIRAEMMHELRYGAGQGGTTPEVEVSIVDPAKVERARAEGALRLNLGCGHLALDGYVNVDLRRIPGVDLVSPVDQLPFQPGEVDEIFSAHLLEHFPQEQLARQLLPYWRDLLRPGGVFRAVTPDIGSMLEGYGDGAIPYEHLREAIFGGQEYEGDFHFNMFTVDTLVKLLESAGFTDVDVEDRGRVNGHCLELQLVAHRPE